jgi:hypothetical protein
MRPQLNVISQGGWETISYSESLTILTLFTSSTTTLVQETHITMIKEGLVTIQRLMTSLLFLSHASQFSLTQQVSINTTSSSISLINQTRPKNPPFKHPWSFSCEELTLNLNHPLSEQTQLLSLFLSQTESHLHHHHLNTLKIYPNLTCKCNFWLLLKYKENPKIYQMFIGSLPTWNPCNFDNNGW